ncbi:MAG: hypothetical protein ABSB35_36860 [Bryobacteraceae bacterium]|jgi:hypothetical protein
MTSLQRRIKAIEKLLLSNATVAFDQAAFEAALAQISPEHRAAYKSSLEAEVARRPLTDCESAARRAFDYVCRQEYRSTPKDPVTEFERLYGARASV